MALSSDFWDEYTKRAFVVVRIAWSDTEITTAVNELFCCAIPQSNFRADVRLEREPVTVASINEDGIGLGDYQCSDIVLRNDDGALWPLVLGVIRSVTVRLFDRAEMATQPNTALWWGSGLTAYMNLAHDIAPRISDIGSGTITLSLDPMRQLRETRAWFVQTASIGFSGSPPYPATISAADQALAPQIYGVGYFARPLRIPGTGASMAARWLLSPGWKIGTLWAVYDNGVPMTFTNNANWLQYGYFETGAPVGEVTAIVTRTYDAGGVQAAKAGIIITDLLTRVPLPSVDFQVGAFARNDSACIKVSESDMMSDVIDRLSRGLFARATPTFGDAYDGRMVLQMEEQPFNSNGGLYGYATATPPPPATVLNNVISYDTRASCHVVNQLPAEPTPVIKWDPNFAQSTAIASGAPDDVRTKLQRDYNSTAVATDLRNVGWAGPVLNRTHELCLYTSGADPGGHRDVRRRKRLIIFEADGRVTHPTGSFTAPGSKVWLAYPPQITNVESTSDVFVPGMLIRLETDWATGAAKVRVATDYISTW